MSRHALSLLLFLLLLLGAPAFGLDPEGARTEETTVSIYYNAAASAFGRTSDRSSLLSVKLSDFGRSSTFPVNRGRGYPTAVLVNRSVKESLDELLASGGRQWVEDSLFYRPRPGDPGIYAFRNDKYGFQIEFALEPVSEAVLAEIKRVYRRTPAYAGEVGRTYRENYTIRIYAAEDVLPPFDGEPRFQEALLCANVLGARFQPLWGMRDGLGLLDELGYALVRRDSRDYSVYDDYRPYQRNRDAMYGFIHRIERLSGEFVHGLWTMTESFRRRGEAGTGAGVDLQLPEDLIETREGDNRDLTLFFYDILRRKGYELKLLVMKETREEAQGTMLLLFRERESHFWGALKGDLLKRDISVNWKRVPALIKDSAVYYRVANPNDLFESGELQFLNDEWSLSSF